MSINGRPEIPWVQAGVPAVDGALLGSSLGSQATQEAALEVGHDGAGRQVQQAVSHQEEDPPVGQTEAPRVEQHREEAGRSQTSGGGVFSKDENMGPGSGPSCDGGAAAAAGRHSGQSCVDHRMEAAGCRLAIPQSLTRALSLTG